MAEKIFTVDKFLGLNESADGTTELKLGEASKIENFTITDNFNLKARPGIRRYVEGVNNNLLRAWTFFSGEYEYLAIICNNIHTNGDCTQILRILRNGEEVYTREEIAFYNLYPYEGHICVLYWDIDMFADTVMPTHIRSIYIDFKENGDFDGVNLVTPYDPLILSGCAPSGGGEEVEKLNLLSKYFYQSFAADGTSKNYVLSPYATSVLWISGIPGSASASKLGSYDEDTHTFVFETAPEKGLTVKFYCETDDSDLEDARDRLLSMPYTELFNGATDTRVFFYGDGSNLCFYSGVPAHGSGPYVPALNELNVDFSNSPITAMVRHYSRLLAFKPDGVDAITYEPVTLADGSVIAGFYLRPVNRDYGNEAPGQVALVNNSPRSFSHGDIYEWRISSNYRDERHAKRISQKVAKTLEGANPAKIIACDDDVAKTYYVFLNDTAGTVLVNRYELDVWSIYRSDLTKNVLQAFSFEGKLMFLCANGVFYFDEEQAFDVAAQGDVENTSITCIWESGYMAFGADYKRKYSSNIWVSMLPESGSDMEITVQTDRRDEYLTKKHGLPLFDFGNMDFSNFSFLTSLAPKIKRIKIKVKKFVYYKLIFRVTKPGGRATILGYDQQVRYSSNVK